MASVEDSVSGREARVFTRPPSTSLIIAIAVFMASVFGILTRPAGFLAMIWPANAVLLGLLIRMPEARRVSVWVAAAAAYMAADLAAGTEVVRGLLLNAANLCGVGAGYLLSLYLPRTALRMREPASALHIVLVSAAAALAAGLAGAAIDPHAMDMGPLNAGLFWFATELVNYIALLPAMLSAPDPRGLLRNVRAVRLGTGLRNAVPAMALIASCLLAMIVGGPGAIAFAMPALLWCGLVYPVFMVSILTFLFSCWALTVMSAAYLTDAAGVFGGHDIVSVRLAAFMIALAPVTLAIVVRNRDELISKLSLARQRIDMAMDAGGIVATWDLDVAESDLSVEGEFPKLFKLDEGSGSTSFHDKLANLIHPDDRERVYDALGAAIATGTDYRCRYRIVTPGGEVRWVAAFGKPVRDRKDAASHLIGILIDVTEQTETAEALEQSNTRFNIVSESIPQIVWSTDANGRHDYFNRRWAEFTGIPLEDVRPETWEYLVHPEDKPRVDATWRDCLATGRTYSIDYRVRYRDGSYRWLKVLAKPFRNAEGAITRWYGTSTDIDDAKQLEAEREIIAHELDHRIGNLFALVNGLVNLAARDGPDVQAVTDGLRGRLSALHDAHGLIRRNRDKALTTMAELLRRLLAPYDNGAERITITGDDLLIDPSATTSITLIFHELATNAVKYGGLRDCEGRLHIELTRTGDRFAIAWRELSPSRAPPGQGTGFGSKLVDSIIEDQLGGKLVRALRPEGLRIDIELPVAALTRTDRKP